MTAQNIQKPEIKWDQRAFDAWQATLPPERIADDEKLLKRIFNLATYSPTLKEALDWAEQHGIKFFIDRTAVNCNGHHTPGTGIIGIVRDKAEKNLQLVAGTVAHEIRHAWQHYHGLNKTLSPSCADYFIGLSLVEADASAFGERVRDELKAVPASLQSSQENRNSDLEGKFLSWFYNSKKTEFYGDKSSKAYGRHWGIYSGDQVKHNFEFAASAPARKEGIDITHVENVLKLGQGFFGENYLAGLPKEILLKGILSPSLANTFYGAANDDQRKLTSDIRKAYLRNKLSRRQAPQRRLP